MKKRVIISVSNDLYTDQRVQKVSQSLQLNKFDVLLIGRKRRTSHSFNANFPFRRIRLIFDKGPLFYAEFNLHLFLKLLFIKGDIFLSNDTDTLPANFLAAKLRGKKLVFDAHEIFPEVPELTNKPFVKWVWSSIERCIFPKLKNAYTVCQSLADYYKERYNVDMKVVRNMPNCNKTSTKNPYKFDGQKIIIYQGAVNIGRGLGWMIDAMPFVDNAIFVIAGGGDIRRPLRMKVAEMKLKHKVKFAGTLSPAELRLHTQNADLGVCLLRNQGLNYYYSLPNRIFDYMQAGIPVLATNFPEIAKYVTENGAGKLIDHYEPEYLASVINEMLAEGKEKYTSNLEAASKIYCWENEEKELLDLFKRLR